MKYLLIIPALLGISIVLIGIYLAPDDLRTCERVPSLEQKCQKADAIVAVSGGNTSLRTAEAIELYKNGWANYLVFSGAARDDASPSNAAVMRAQALRAGVVSDAIVIDETSRTTHQNAENVKELFKQNSISSVIVVTSPYHQRRAGLEFQQRLQNVQVRNHPAQDSSDWPWYWWATPRGWWLAIGELIKVGATHAGGSS
jgi:uncharacterized SAM-binding protein YcdF (DUF218 family)